MKIHSIQSSVKRCLCFPIILSSNNGYRIIRRFHRVSFYTFSLYIHFIRRIATDVCSCEVCTGVEEACCATDEKSADLLVSFLFVVASRPRSVFENGFRDNRKGGSFPRVRLSRLVMRSRDYLNIVRASYI